MNSDGTSSLFVIQFGSNVGYAIGPLEALFFELGLHLGNGNAGLVHFAYRDLEKGHPKSLPEDFKNIAAFNVESGNSQVAEDLAEYVRKHRIRLVMFFDVHPVSPLYRKLRLSGATTLLSYYGAPVSSVMPLWKLAIKRLLLWCSRSKLDGLIFESQAMADLAILGRGVPRDMIDIVPLGVDISKFSPGRTDYAYTTLCIPRDQKIVIYAGHMERRKGVRTLVEAAIELIVNRKRTDVCFLICGNKGDESREYEAMYSELHIEDKIRFGGYRSDMSRLYSSCLCGVIPSTGWDSFPRTSIEMAALGLPVIASRLQGLCEAVIDGETGLLFEPGDATALADLLERILDNPTLAETLGRNGRLRCERELNLEVQKARFLDVIQKRLSLSMNN